MTSALARTRHDTLSSITVRQFSDNPYGGSGLGAMDAPLTRLRVCEPSDVWHSPSSILASFGCTRELTHLQLPRRLNGNETNDEIFVEEVKQILLSRPGLKMLVLSLFPATWGEDCDVAESNIARMLDGVDERLVIARGCYNNWKVSPW